MLIVSRAGRGSNRVDVADNRAPQDLNGVAADVYLDPPVVTAGEGYRTCMASQGHPVRFPHDAVELAQRSAAPRLPELTAHLC